MSGWLKQKFELARGTDAPHLPSMEGLRGLAVLLVFFVHYMSLVKPWIAQEADLLSFASALGTLGNSGVDLFFVLSGYLIYGSLVTQRQRFLPFLGRRIQRIYPVFSATFALYVVLSLLFPAYNKIPPAAGDAAVYLLQNLLLLPGLFPIEPLIAVAWSLSYGMFFYLAVPRLIATLKLRDVPCAWRVTMLLFIAVSLVIYTALYGGPVRLIMFISGMVLFETLTHSQLRVSAIAGLVALAIGLLGMLLPIAAPAGEPIRVSILFVAFFVLGLACFRTPTAPLSRAFSWTPLRWLGNMSYSYYLIHSLGLQAGFLMLAKLVPPTGEQSALFWILLAPMLALTLIVSAPLYLLIERPFSLAPRQARGASDMPQAASASESGS